MNKRLNRSNVDVKTSLDLQKIVFNKLQPDLQSLRADIKGQSKAKLQGLKTCHLLAFAIGASFSILNGRLLSRGNAEIKSTQSSNNSFKAPMSETITPQGHKMPQIFKARSERYPRLYCDSTKHRSHIFGTQS
jgi:hypothetical protein